VLTLYRLQVDSYGKTLVLLSGGGLALSITFLEKIAGKTPVHVWMLVVGWGLLIATLLSSLSALLLSSQAMLKAIDGYPWSEPQPAVVAVGGSDVPADLGGRSATAVKVLNWVAVVVLAAGVGFVAVFALTNLNGGAR
jgi:hypothetical protein